MKISQVSTQAMFDNLRHSMSNLQRDFTDAQKEVATGQVSDAGLSLGANNGRRFNMMNDINRLQVITDTNNRTQETNHWCCSRNSSQNTDITL